MSYGVVFTHDLSGKWRNFSVQLTSHLASLSLLVFIPFPIASPPTWLSKLLKFFSSETACSWKEIRLELFINMIEKAKRQSEGGARRRGRREKRGNRDRDTSVGRKEERGWEGKQERWKTEIQRETGEWGRDSWTLWAGWVMRCRFQTSYIHSFSLSHSW